MTEQITDARPQDDLAWYSAAIAGEKPAIHDGQPQSGWFRSRKNKDGRWLPTVIYRDTESGKLIAYRGFSHQIEGVADVDVYQPVDIKKIWPWVAEEWVVWDRFDEAFRTGEWPGSAPPIGDNQEPQGYEALKAALVEQAAEAAAWLKRASPLKTKVDGDKARDWEEKINKLRLEADKLFRAEKDPINEKATACDEKWSFRKQAVSAATSLKAAWSAVAKRLEDEAQAQVKAELDKGTPVENLKPVEKVVIGGTSTGSGKSLRTKMVCVIKDYDKVIEYLKTTPQMKEWLDEHVKRLHGAGVEVPGTAVEKLRVA